MRKICYILLTLVLIGMVNCSQEGDKTCTVVEINGVKVYKNRDKPSQKDLMIVPKKVFTITGEDQRITDPGRKFIWPRYLDIDSQGNIYIVDSPSASVKKFDRTGKFIKSFGKKGSGPGEMRYPFMVSVLDNVVYVTDPAERRMVTFDTEGNFIRNIKLTQGIPNFISTVGKDKFTAFMSRFEQKEGIPYHTFDLLLMNSQFKEIAVLSKFESKVDRTYNDFHDRYTAYAVGKDKIYAAENSTRRYKINVFDFTGKLLYSIEKDYKKVRFNQDELEELNHTLKSLFKKAGRLTYQPIKKSYKKAVNNLYCDKEGRLLAAFSIKRDETNQFDFLVDVFKDGIFLGRIKLDIARAYDFIKLQDRKIFFKGNRIFIIDEPEPAVTVFEY
ncbi:MAG: 6-bladed beta-propeller [Candidatus Aminicenantes bacterium]|nr:MAG: 6-bladed beta-propeller [Candidatus Aminicenantes bacterium]